MLHPLIKKHRFKLIAVGALVLIISYMLLTEDTSIVDISRQLTRSTTREYPYRKLSLVEEIIVHHTAMSRDTFTVWQTADLHVNKNGWPGIGYHYFITATGTIFQTNSIRRMSYHATDHNMKSIGVCLAGNFEEEKPSAAQIIALAKLLKRLKRQVSRAVVLRHSDCTATLCPGKNLDLEAVIKLSEQNLDE